MSEDLEAYIKKVKEIKIGLGEQLVEKLLNDLKKADKIDKHTEIYDLLENDSGYPIQEAGYFIEQGIKRINKRKALDKNRTDYYSSPNRKNREIPDKDYSG